MMIERFCSSLAGPWGFPGNFGLWGLIGFLANLVFWAGLITALVVFLIWAARRGRIRGAAGQPTAAEILQARYARGEITREQYRQMQQDLA
jgi:putative membrane protein